MPFRDVNRYPSAHQWASAPARPAWSAGLHDAARWSDPRGLGPSGLAPRRKQPPGRGWRRVVYRATFGAVNLGRSPGELREAALEARVRAPLRRRYKIGVLGKGGVGKTTVAASVGSLFAELLQDDRVVAIDADTAFGKLGARIDPSHVCSYWDLVDDPHLDRFADVRRWLGTNAAGLFVLPGEASGAARPRVLDPAIYREAASHLDRHFLISIIDCGSTLNSPVTEEVLVDLDALIVVSSLWVDAVSAAGQILEWLANRGLTRLLARTVVVLNDSDGYADQQTRAALVEQFKSRGQVVIEVPFDAHLRPGGVIAGSLDLGAATRRCFLQVAAAITDHFSSTAVRA